MILHVGHVTGIDRAVHGNVLTEVSSSYDPAGLAISLADVRRVTGTASLVSPNESSSSFRSRTRSRYRHCLNIENVDGNSLRVRQFVRLPVT